MYTTNNNKMVPRKTFFELNVSLAIGKAKADEFLTDMQKQVNQDLSAVQDFLRDKLPCGGASKRIVKFVAYREVEAVFALVQMEDAINLDQSKLVFKAVLCKFLGSSVDFAMSAFPADITETVFKKELDGINKKHCSCKVEQRQFKFWFLSGMSISFRHTMKNMNVKCMCKIKSLKVLDKDVEDKK